MLAGERERLFVPRIHSTGLSACCCRYGRGLVLEGVGHALQRRRSARRPGEGTCCPRQRSDRTGGGGGTLRGARSLHADLLATEASGHPSRGSHGHPAARGSRAADRELRGPAIGQVPGDLHVRHIPDRAEAGPGERHLGVAAAQTTGLRPDTHPGPGRQRVADELPAHVGQRRDEGVDRPRRLRSSWYPTQTGGRLRGGRERVGDLAAVRDRLQSEERFDGAGGAVLRLAAEHGVAGTARSAPVRPGSGRRSPVR